MKISDVTGNNIIAKKIMLNSTSIEIDLSKLINHNLPAGVYFIELASLQSKQVKKLVIE